MIEPAWLAIAMLVGVPLNMAIGAFLSRHDFAALNRLSQEVLKHATPDDRVRLREITSESTMRWPLWLLAVTAPLWFIPLFVVAIFDASRGMPDDELLAEAREAMERSRAMSKKIEAIIGKQEPPRHSEAFMSLRSDLENASTGAAMLSSPAIGLWLVIWAAPSLAVYAATGAAGGALTRLREAQHFIFARFAH